MIPMASCLTYISDRKAGTLERSLVAGVKDIHILIAYMISEGSLIIIQLILSFGILLTVFDFSVKGSYLMFYLIVFLEGLTGLSLGKMFVSPFIELANVN
jgi:ABC-type transport system involved in Fe-S cluster assembly fused permease/ATPase subunit